MEIQVDGNLTQNENLADIAGLQVALKAYQNYLEKYDSTDQLLMEKMKLPGLNLTARQIYFLSVAQVSTTN
jgi:predicted metalloendopeptidase